MAMKIRGILFDLGDTLLNFGQVDVRALFEDGARLAYDYLKGLGQPLPEFAKYHRHQLWAIRWNYFISMIRRREFNSMDLMGKLGKRMGHDLNPQQLTELAWKWYEPLGKCATIEQGTKEMLEKFRDKNIKLGIISNTFVPGEVLDRHLSQVSLIELLPIRVYSCDVSFRKPHPNIFEMALQKAELGPQETIFVGDSIQADIAGSNKAKMISVLKDPLGRHAKSPIKPKHSIRQLAELEGIVEQYNSL